MKDLYEVLGVSKNATEKEIKDAYRNLARTHHPDLNPNNPESEELFKEINNAYSILSDSNKKQAYDNGQMNDRGESQNQQWGGNINFDDFFNPFQQHIYEPRKMNPNTDIHITLILEPHLSFQEQSQTIKLERLKYCDDCEGEGGKDGQITCPDCHGSGFSGQKINHMIISSPCNRCNQKGYIYNQVCDICHGFGVQKEETTYTVKIPVGSYFKKLRIAEGGHYSNNKFPPGNLIVSTIPPNPYNKFQFANDGTTYIEIPVDPIEMLMGAEMQVKDILNENITIQIQPGSPDKQIIKIPNYGLPINEKMRGMFAVILKYDYNISLTEEQKNILNKYLETKKEKEVITK